MKSIILTIAVFTLTLPFSNSAAQYSSNKIEKADSVAQRNAFEILKVKCNSCHISKNPRKVFTYENMNDYAPKIHKQVFIKKRMPKGNKVQLTTAEYDVLKIWLASQTTNQ